MSRLLLDEAPLLVIRTLAVKVGLNEAIVLQQLHWRLGRDTALETPDGRWTQASIEDWREDFPFWSEATIKRAFSELRAAGLVKTKRGREANVYTLDYVRMDQIDPSNGSICAPETDQNDPAPCKREEKKREKTTAVTAAADVEQTSLLPLPPSMPDAKAAEKAEQDAKLAALWEHYLAVFGDKLRVKTLTPAREKSFRKGLVATAWDLELCKVSISGLKSYRDSHPDGSTDVSPSVIFETGPHSGRSLTDQIEWWAQQSDSGTAVAHPEVPSVLRERINQRRLTVVHMHQQPDNGSLRDRGEQALRWLAQHANERPIVENGKVTGWEQIA